MRYVGPAHWLDSVPSRSKSNLTFTHHIQHEFVRVADDFKSLVLPFTATAFLAQINLLLCSWSLLLKTRARLHHLSYLKYLGQKLRLSGLLQRLRAARATTPTPTRTNTAVSPLEVQLVAQEAPTVAEALKSAAARATAARAKASVRNRRKRERRRRLVLEEAVPGAASTTSEGAQ